MERAPKVALGKDPLYLHLEKVSKELTAAALKWYMILIILSQKSFMKNVKFPLKFTKNV